MNPFELSPEAEEFIESAKILAEPYEAKIAELRRQLAEVRRDTLNDALEVVSCEVDRLPPIDARIALVELRMKLRGLRDEAES